MTTWLRYQDLRASQETRISNWAKVKRDPKPLKVFGEMGGRDEIEEMVVVLSKFQNSLL